VSVLVHLPQRSERTRRRPSEGPSRTLSERVASVVAIAADCADDVDRESRFPHESVQALKSARLLGMAIPREFGGEGASLMDIADICARLGAQCASSGMVFAMHQIKVASLIAHGGESLWHQALMRHIAEAQLLVASSTTEAGIGGDLRNSLCAVEVEGETFRLEKEASVISYGTFADVILATARRAPDAPSSDQVLVAMLRGQYTLERTGGWNTLGMRGTCSEGFRLRAEGAQAQILPKPFAEIAATSMLASSHLLWGALWSGIASAALMKAQSFVRGEARKRPGAVPPGALHVAEAVNKLQLVRSSVSEGLRRFAAADSNAADLTSMGFAVAMNNVKLGASEIALDIVTTAMRVCGIAGYRNDGPFSVGRHLRDIMSAQLMISNDRILANTSNLLLVHRLDSGLVS
jgi:acyl-CoA dehydrogenase